MPVGHGLEPDLWFAGPHGFTLLINDVPYFRRYLCNADAGVQLDKHLEGIIGPVRTAVFYPTFRLFLVGKREEIAKLERRIGGDILDHPGDPDFPLVVNPDRLAHGIFIGEQGPGGGLVDDDGVWVFEHGKRIAFDKRETEHWRKSGATAPPFRNSFLSSAKGHGFHARPQRFRRRV